MLCRLFGMGLMMLACLACMENDRDDESGGSAVKRKIYENCVDAPSFRSSSSSKTAEARRVIGAIARGAAGAYEREPAAGPSPPRHTLCKSAVPVPLAGPPKGVAYQPNSAAGADFETGDVAGGWRCLKFSMTQPHHFQYGYTAGSDYKGPKFGLPDPGPDAYEAWAIGDLDGDGRLSLHVVTGVVDKSTGRLKRSAKLACVDPLE